MMGTDYEYDTAPEPIDYRECAWLWMSADAAIEAREQNPSEPFDRAKFTAALAELKESLEQAGSKPGDPP